MEYLEDMTYMCLHSPKTMKETRSNTPYPEEGNTSYSSYMEIKYSRRYQTWSLLQETLDTSKHFKTLSLDESRSPDFDLFSNQEEYLEEKVAETMAEQAIVKYPKGIAKNVLVGIGKFIFPVDFIILDIPEDIKVPLILERPFLPTTHAKIDVFKKKITLRVREEKIIFKSVKSARSLIKRVYMLSLRERMELDLDARLMGETLVLNRSLVPFFEDYIKLNNFNVPLALRRDKVDDLMPTIKEGEVIEEFRARNDARMVSKFFGYPSNCDYDKKIHIDCAYNLKFTCMVGPRCKEIDKVGDVSIIWNPMSKSIAAIWLEKVVTPLIEPAIKGFAAAPAVLKPKSLKVDKAQYE
nr:hypothetical protein [Tanacetum cinerariifolium]